MLPNFKRYFELYCESITGIVWHYTREPLKILKSNMFSLGMETGVDTTKGGKIFYMSTARSKFNNYSENNPSGVIFKLDGDLLNTRHKGKAFDYWSNSNIKNRGEGISEMEDRIYSDQPTIPNAKKYIMEVITWCNPESSYMNTLKEVEDICKRDDIPFVYYTSYKNFSTNKDPQPNIPDTIKITEPYERYGKFYKKRDIRNILLFLTQLKDVDREYANYNARLSLGHKINNEIRRSHNKPAIYAKRIIAKLIKRFKLKNVDDLIKLRISQNEKMLRNKNEIYYIDRTFNKFVDMMEDGQTTDPYGNDPIWDFNKQYLDGTDESYYNLYRTVSRKDMDSLKQIFSSVKETMRNEMADIEKTFLDIPLKDLPEKKIDYSWRQEQI
jgi:hypothetical protein